MILCHGSPDLSRTDFHNDCCCTGCFVFLTVLRQDFIFLFLYFLSLSLKYSLNASFTARFTIEYKPNIKISIDIMMIGNHSILILLCISEY